MKLKPCPFCGGKARILEVKEPTNAGGYVVQCDDCEASTRVWFPIKDDVKPILRDAWNRRSEVGALPLPQEASPQPYRVEPEGNGCEHCGANHLWTVVGPDDVGVSRSFQDRSDASDLADDMNDAFRAGRASVSQGPQEPELDVQLVAWAVVNCHMLARRALAWSTSAFDREKWEHVLRICEKAGARSSGVLKASVPTEITDGEGPQEAPQASQNDDVLEDIACDLLVDLCEGDGEHSEALDRALIMKALKRVRASVLQGPK